MGTAPRHRFFSKVSYYQWAVAFAFFVYLAHLISLPVGITYDGHIYIDLADVLWSKRFPQDWFFARTPLYPCALKLSFWLFGKQPLSAIFVSSTAGLVGILAVGSAVKRFIGTAAGAVTVVLLSLFPTLVAYQHFVLTETGTFCFLALILCLLVWRPNDRRLLWWKTGSVTFVIAAGYYWRQNIVFMAPFAALVHALSAWKPVVVTARPRPDLWRMAVQVVLIAILPSALTWPWSRLSNNKGLRDVMLEYGILKQALLPPEDPFVGDNAKEYRSAIQESLYAGHLYCGLRADLHRTLSEKIFAKQLNESVPSFFLSLVRKYPRRYIAGVFRTLVLFAGVRGLQNENYIFREQILSPTFLGSKIGEGPASIEQADKENFLQRTTDSAVLRFFWRASPFYDSWLMLAWGLTVIGLIVSLFLRNLALFVFCAMPLYYVLPYAVMLSAVDRYAFPVYPLVVAVPPAFVGAILTSLGTRKNKAARCARRDRGTMRKGEEPYPSVKG